MRFHELILQIPEDELRLRFHPQLTVLSGIGPAERLALSDSIVGALAGGTEDTALRYLDASGEPVVVLCRDGRISARRDDGTPVPEPIGTLASSRRDLRALMVVTADDLGPEVRRSREDEPPELAEARDTLEELTAELEAARAEQAATAGRRAELAELDEALRLAREGAARREYALVLAQLERVRAEAAAVQSDEAAIDADRRLLEAGDEVRELARRWALATAQVVEMSEGDAGERLTADEREALVDVPASPPEDLVVLVQALGDAAHRRDDVDRRLQDLAVSQLPAPSSPFVAELGVLDQGALWAAAERLTAATAARREVQVSLGGLELDDLGPPSSVIAEIEAAHAEREEAERAVEAIRVPAWGGTVLGAVAGVAGLATAPILVPVGLGAAAVAAVAGIVRPNLRLSRATRDERRALDRAGASSYLGFHIRRVEASVDPHLRETVEASFDEQRQAEAAWAELVGEEVSLDAAIAAEAEIRAYHEAVQDLGETADEMEHLRRELEQAAVPAWRAARQALAERCAPYAVADEALDDPRLPSLVEEQCRRGGLARAQARLHEAEVVAQATADRLAGRLAPLGFDTGNLDARVGALEWAITRAEEREDARRRARPREEIEAELAQLTESAAALRRPEWDAVTAAEAETPDLAELEARREAVAAGLGSGGAEIDVERLADRHAAVERRVAALEARLGTGTNGDPGALADLQQALLGRLTGAGGAGPAGDPVPVVLDEAFQRVPPDRSWDLLDLLLRLAERHQVIYLTNDAFVAAWARQRALDGSITLLEPEADADAEHEPV